MDLIVLGISHKTAPAQIRDEVQVHPEEMGTAYHMLRAHSDLLRETVILSTCNRTEFYAFVGDKSEAEQLLREAANELKGVDHFNSATHTYSWSGMETVRHLFRVASGLESMMVGEAQILGQVKEAFEAADRHKSMGAILTRLFTSAVHVGKRARNETEIGKGTVSMAHAAMEMADKIFGGLRRHPILVLGAGETGTAVARHFAEAGPKLLTIMNRTFHRAQELALELGVVARPWEEMDDALTEARVIVVATGSRQPIIDVERMTRVLQGSTRGPKIMVDIANPRNVQPEVRNLDRVFLYNIDDLEEIADQNRVRRRREIPKVEKIVLQEVGRYMSWQESLDMVPVIRALRGRFQEIAEKEMARQVKNFEPADIEALKGYTRSLLNKLLHQPTTLIRGVEPSTRHGIHKLVAIQELFELDLEAFGESSEESEEDHSGREGSERVSEDSASSVRDEVEGPGKGRGSES
ncbi:MAG: glutamyl-tRNA reductase [Gemmatimonadota bacterium]|jgi:glutamyl-tRNA reductase